MNYSGKNIAGEALDVPAGRHTGSVARDAAIYHHQHYQQQQQQLQPGIPKHISVPAPMGRGWDSSCPSPGWDTTTQRNARYTASGRGRGNTVCFLYQSINAFYLFMHCLLRANELTK